MTSIEYRLDIHFLPKRRKKTVEKTCFVTVTINHELGDKKTITVSDMFGHIEKDEYTVEYVTEYFKKGGVDIVDRILKNTTSRQKQPSSYQLTFED